ncbi:hypothetical protein BB558_004235 [Smittium angustum]|uniref:Anaphase-promoting complex subunit 5 n=1 Tax=Smittium angustum TaxID=133377 RepID=A0A2U1J2F0_SMIAN|nr:hypothetical protein BB558_004787 [Smittium angustum]PVZ99729.1 hypothetical protein BB558_004235 [Smittium angustum]
MEKIGFRQLFLLNCINYYSNDFELTFIDRTRFSLIILDLMNVDSSFSDDKFLSVSRNLESIVIETYEQETLFSHSITEISKIETTEDLSSFVEGLQSLFYSRDEPENGIVDTIVLDRKGVFGLYIRQVSIDIALLDFADLCSVVDSIQAYIANNFLNREETNSSSLNQSEMGIFENDENISRLEPEDNFTMGFIEHNIENKDVVDTNKQIDTEYLNLQMELLQKNVLVSDPVNLKNKIEEMINSINKESKHYYFKYLDAANEGDFYLAEDMLRLFFESAFDQESYYVHSSNNNPDVFGIQTVYPNSVVFAGFQYSLLYLSVLRIKFGYYELAQKSLDEALGIAQEQQDYDCLLLIDQWESKLLLEEILENKGFENSDDIDKEKYVEKAIILGEKLKQLEMMTNTEKTKEMYISTKLDQLLLNLKTVSINSVDF